MPIQDVIFTMHTQLILDLSVISLMSETMGMVLGPLQMEIPTPNPFWYNRRFHGLLPLITIQSLYCTKTHYLHKLHPDNLQCWTV